MEESRREPEASYGQNRQHQRERIIIEIPTRLHRATSIMIKVMLPPEVTQVPLELLCQGRVVRWNQHGKNQGLGAVIDEYELRPVPRTGSGGKRTQAAARQSD